MADRVLPSRAFYYLHDSLGIADEEDIARLKISGVLIPVESGRLVDREAIDYEAAYQWANENFVPQKFVDQCLDAALKEV